MTHSNACQKHERAASKGVEDWLIYIYIYVCDAIHQTLNFSASAEILIGF